MEERFDYLRLKSREELEQIKKELSDEVDQLFEYLDDKDISSSEKAEIRNDLSYAKDKLQYVESIINETKTI